MPLALLLLLRRHGHFRVDRRTIGKIPRIAAATLGMAAVLVLFRLFVAAALAGPAMVRLAALAGLIAAGLFSFAALAFAFGETDWRELRRRLRRQAA